LCSAEIGYYNKIDTINLLRLIDVSSDDFVEDAYLTRQSALSRFHVQKTDGQILSGAQGFVEVWRVLPRWVWLAKFAKIPGVLHILELLYQLFLRVRPVTIRLLMGWHRFFGVRP
jgi:predicted DCC family thiol-disulfide oxidoreductase YuxK